MQKITRFLWDEVLYTLNNTPNVYFIPQLVNKKSNTYINLKILKVLTVVIRKELEF